MCVLYMCNISNPNRHMFVCVLYEYMQCKYVYSCVCLCVMYVCG